MKWVIIKGTRYPSSVISAFAAYNIDKHFLKIRIRNKYNIVPFDDINKMDSQMVYLMNNYPDFVQIGRWWISKKAVCLGFPRGRPWTDRAGLYHSPYPLDWREGRKLDLIKKMNT